MPVSILAHNGQTSAHDLVLLVGAFVAPVVLLAIVIVVGKLRGEDPDDPADPDVEAPQDVGGTDQPGTSEPADA